jgi:hypothetical protein
VLERVLTSPTLGEFLDQAFPFRSGFASGAGPIAQEFADRTGLPVESPPQFKSDLREGF